jgi:hypothetical protein
MKRTAKKNNNLLTNRKIQVWNSSLKMNPLNLLYRRDNVTSDKINYSNILIVLVGQKTAQAAHVAKEISAANSQNIPIVGVYVGGADHTTELPRGLQRSRTVELEWEEISDRVEQAMKEGKNELLWTS